MSSLATGVLQASPPRTRASIVRAPPVAEAEVCEAFAAIDAASGDISLTYFEYGALAALENAFGGPQGERYELRSEDLLKADAEARRQGLDLIGIFHSHPDCDAYFSKTDLENSCPWYSFVVLSIRNGEFHHANSWLPNFEQTEAAKEELTY